MKKVLSILIIMCLPFGLCAQRKDLTPRVDIEGVLKASYESYPKGTPVTVTSVTSLDNRSLKGIYLSVSIDNIQVPIPAKKAGKLLELHPKTMEQFWMSEYINANMFDYYNKKGYSRSLRNELIDESEDYLETLDHLFYDDAFITEYIRTIFLKATPREFNNKRTERATVKIVQSPDPYANMLANGTLLISTGLLSTLDSEEELTAIIASNIAHYVLDHPVLNIKKQISRARRAEFWGGFMVVVAGGLEIALAETSDSYIPGGIILTTAIAGEALSYSAAQRLGMGYDKKQLKAADRIAVDYLKFAEIDPAALSCALYKIGNYHVHHPNTTSKENFNNLKQRIKDLQQPRKDFESPTYQRKVSGVNTVNAIIQLNSDNYDAARKLAQKNIDNKMATDEDYVVLVKVDMQFAVTPEENERCLELIKKGKAISDIPNLELYKQEIMLHIRLEQPQRADKCAQDYITLLTDFKANASDENDRNWASDEISWAKKIRNQLKY